MVIVTIIIGDICMYVYIYVGNNNNNNCNNSKNRWLVVWNFFFVSIYWEESSQLTFIFFRCSSPLPPLASCEAVCTAGTRDRPLQLPSPVGWGFYDGNSWDSMGIHRIWWDKKPPNILGSLIHKNFGALLTWLSGTRCDKKPPTTLGDSKIPSGYLT